MFPHVTLYTLVWTGFTEGIRMARSCLGTMSQVQALSPQAVFAAQIAGSITEVVLFPYPKPKVTKDADHLHHALPERNLQHWYESKMKEACSGWARGLWCGFPELGSTMKQEWIWLQGAVGDGMWVGLLG